MMAGGGDPQGSRKTLEDHHVKVVVAERTIDELECGGADAILVERGDVDQLSLAALEVREKGCSERLFRFELVGI